MALRPGSAKWVPSAERWLADDAPSSEAVAEARTQGSAVTYPTERGEEVSFVLVGKRLARFVDGQWSNWALSLAYTSSEGAVRDQRGQCGVPQVGSAAEMRKLLSALHQLALAARISTNLHLYTSEKTFDEEWWAPKGAEVGSPVRFPAWMRGEDPDEGRRTSRAPVRRSVVDIPPADSAKLALVTPHGVGLSGTGDAVRTTALSPTGKLTGRYLQMLTSQGEPSLAKRHPAFGVHNYPSSLAWFDPDAEGEGKADGADAASPAAPAAE
eukprot:TRINITY_DN952_c0_g2_i1.p1 TRINITY_DN952_c0_g2~~TRINITY_DN952_c0_g2_i1.p1  ORF type:complete len:269 (+),score=67.34 TRINITY_DN952_c0_g2_i1:88-894(+)